jgi:hypothetical protein
MVLLLMYAKHSSALRKYHLRETVLVTFVKPMLIKPIVQCVCDWPFMQHIERSWLPECSLSATSAAIQPRPSHKSSANSPITVTFMMYRFWRMLRVIAHFKDAPALDRTILSPTDLRCGPRNMKCFRYFKLIPVL